MSPGYFGTNRKALFMSMFARRAPGPNLDIMSITASNEAYSIVHKSGSMKELFPEELG